MSIFDSVNPIAQQFGVPTRLWESIAQVESSFNPGLVGDNGTSFGLFQLHRGGQAPDNVSDSALLDPKINAQYALPAIATAWKQLGSSFDDSLTWWSHFAAISGHPGYDPTLDTLVGGELKQAYDSTGGTSIGLASTTKSTSSTSSSSSSQDVGVWLGNIGLVALVFLIGIVLVIIAMVLLR